MINDLGRCKIHPTAAHFERLWVFLWPGMTPQPFFPHPWSKIY